MVEPTERARPGHSPRTWAGLPYLLLALLALGLAIRLAFALLPLKQLLIMLEDDAWMVTAIARNWAIGHGISADGLNPTNGFHPLYPLTLGAIPYLLAPNALDAGFRVNLIFCALLGTAAGIPLYRLTRRFAGDKGALLAAAIYLVNPYFARVTVNAMETSMGLLLLLWLADRFFSFDRRSWKAALGLGLIAGLAGLARLDNWILAAMVGVALVWEVVSGRRASLSAPPSPPASGGEKIGLRLQAPPRSRGGWGGPLLPGLTIPLSYAIGVALLALPYFAWNYLVFGSLGPSSGRALSYMHSYANGFSLTNVLHFVYLNPALNLEFLPSTVLALLIAVLLVGAYFFLLPPTVRRPLLPLAGYVAVELLYYAYLLQNSNPRYFFGPAAFFCVLVGALYGRFEQRLRPALQTAAVAVVLLLFVGLNTYEPFQAYRISSRMPQLTQPAIYQAALWVRDNLPADALIASKNSGLMQYYSGHVVLNIDGKLNGEIVPVLVQRQLLSYLQDKGVTYLVDREEAVSRHIELYSQQFGPWPAHQEVSALQKAGIYLQLGLSRVGLDQAPVLDDPSNFQPSHPFSDVAEAVHTFPRPNSAEDPVVVFRLKEVTP